ncbi:MAG TPA: hypothetical protein VHM72_06085, partial [Solirubrobacteraceae bacterium]|nr:hypothetical protein [Solirubrobacteraceae bacterium]
AAASALARHVGFRFPRVPRLSALEQRCLCANERRARPEVVTMVRRLLLHAWSSYREVVTAPLQEQPRRRAVGHGRFDGGAGGDTASATTRLSRPCTTAGWST